MQNTQTTPLPSASLSTRESSESFQNDGSATPAESRRQVTKRDGRVVDWDRSLIERALRLAYENNDPSAASNLEALAEKVTRLAEGVEQAVWHRAAEADDPISIESIQDVAETCIAAVGDWEVARAYVRYRTQRAERRPKRHGDCGLAEYIAVSRYARYRSDLGRREVWEESVQRVRDMHLRRFASLAARKPETATITAIADQLKLSPDERRILGGDHSLFEEIWEAFDAVERRQALPSMRSLQFGGAAIEANEARIYNCSFSHADRPAFFRECFYLLLSGVGVGFSVQTHHVAALPGLPEREPDSDLPVRHVTIEDSIEGWSDAIDALFTSHYEGWLAEFSFTQVRPRGAPLVTSGGKAPGHLPLKNSLNDISRILRQAAGRHLRPIEVYDSVMLIARAVLAGGIRRSATICLFSPDDEEMANAKTGNWFETHPHRAYSNNSALIVRERAEPTTFKDLFNRIRESGEPGFYFAEDEEYGANPCVEIGLCPRATLDEAAIARLRELGHKGQLEPGQSISGWQMCNLSTVNGAAVECPEDFFRACRTAALLGTLQAAYSKIAYLGPVTRFLNEREALLGVSLCGVLDRPKVLLDPQVLEAGARMVKATNALFASLIGIERAARTTCVKPEGTASLLLGAGSGIHPHHAPRYFRRVQVNRHDPVYRHFKANNPDMTEASVYSPDTDDVITFPMEAPEGGLCRGDIDGPKFLEHVLLVQKHWVEAGLAHDKYNPGLLHNVSNTVTPEDMTMDMHMLGLMYAPTDDFTLMLMGNYVDSSMDHRIFSQMAANMINGGATTFTTEASGLGDTTLTALYGLHPGNGIEVIAGLGLSLPTGSITESDTLPGMGGPMDRRLPAAMQLGSGTYDLLPFVTWIHDLAPWAYGVQARGVIRMEDENSEGYRRGHVFALTSWVSYKLSHGFTLSAGTEYERTGELKGTQSDVSRMGPNGRSVTTAFGENYGGERIDAILGLHYQGTTGWLRGHRIGLDLRLPVHQNLNGQQLETDSVVTLGWQKVF